MRRQTRKPSAIPIRTTTTAPTAIPAIALSDIPLLFGAGVCADTEVPLLLGPARGVHELFHDSTHERPLPAGGSPFSLGL